MDKPDPRIAVRRGRLTLPAWLRREAGLGDEARLQVRVVDGAFVLYESPPAFLAPAREAPPKPVEQPAPFESANCAEEAQRLRAVECIPARDLDSYGAEAMRLVMSDLRLMAAGLTVYDVRGRVLRAAFTSMDGYLVSEELIAFAPQSRQILGVTRRPTWIREPWADPRIRLYDRARLPRTSCFAAPVFLAEQLSALLFGFWRRSSPAENTLMAQGARMAAALAVSLHPHLSDESAPAREVWRPVSDTVLCRGCSRWTPVARSHRPAGAMHHERYCPECWERRVPRGRAG